MAVLGAQLVVTLVMVSIIQKLNPHFSFAKWILCSTGLIRYLHPTDDVLRAKGGVPKEKPQPRGKGGGGGKYHGEKNGVTATSGQFHVPRSIEVELETTPVVERDVVHLRYFTEYQWLVDFSIYAGIVYVFSEVYHYYFPLKNEANLSMVWCLLVVFFAIKLLSSLTVLYFQSEESIGERSMVIVACLVYLLIAMIVLIIDERILETGLEDAYASFNQSASKFLNDQGLKSSGPASKIVVKFFIALGCGVLGSLFTFPGLRMAKMHWDSLKYCRDSKLKQVILNLSFVLPFILVVLWIRPISRDYLTVRIFDGMDKPLLTPHVFETLRLLLVVIVVVLRFTLMPIYLQSYLNLAYDKIMDLRKEAGRITNVEFQKKISSIFYYLCVVTLQFAAPLILCLYLTLMYKSLGGFSWTGLVSDSVVLQNECSADAHARDHRGQRLCGGGPRLGRRCVRLGRRIQHSGVRPVVASLADQSEECLLDGGVQGLPGFRHLVELLHAVRHHLAGHHLSVVLQQVVGRLRRRPRRRRRHKAIFLNHFPRLFGGNARATATAFEPNGILASKSLTQSVSHSISQSVSRSVSHSELSEGV